MIKTKWYYVEVVFAEEFGQLNWVGSSACLIIPSIEAELPIVLLHSTCVQGQAAQGLLAEALSLRRTGQEREALETKQRKPLHANIF